MGVARVEQEFADQVLACVQLDGDWRQTVLKALANQGPRPDHSLDVKRIESALANLRKQHLWGAIDDGTFKAEHQVLQRQVKSIQPSSPQLMMPNLDRASRLLQDLPALWNHPGVTPAQQRGLGPGGVPGGTLEGRLAGRGQTQAQIRTTFCLCAMASACCRWCAFILSLSKVCSGK